MTHTMMDSERWHRENSGFYALFQTLQESQTCKTIMLLQQFLVWAPCRKSEKCGTISSCSLISPSRVSHYFHALFCFIVVANDASSARFKAERKLDFLFGHAVLRTNLCFSVALLAGLVVKTVSLIPSGS